MGVNIHAFVVHIENRILSKSGNYVIFTDRKTREPGGLPSSEGLNPPDERKEGTPMTITYSDFVQTGIFIVALVGLCYTIFRGRK